MSDKVFSFEEALGVVLREAATVSVRTSERVPLMDAVGRTLAEPVSADRDQPPFNRSTRDGFALRAADAGGDLVVVGSVRAGEQWNGPALDIGQAIELMTGAPLPHGADAVVMVEHVTRDGEMLRFAQGRTLTPGENVVPQGAEARAGAGVLRAGSVIGAAEIAVAASCGCVRLPVFVRPPVGIVATGDELVELDATPEEWQIRNSNTYALAAMVEAEGGIAERFPTARDTREDVTRQVEGGAECDLLVLSGGVSAGKYDLVEEVLASRGAQFFFTGALIQPGKPVVFGRLPKAGVWIYFFGLPGNPVSTQVTFALFVAPMLRALAGRTDCAPRFVEARLAEGIAGARVTRFLPAEISGDWKGVSVRAVGWQGSGDVSANARGNSYLMLPAGVERFSEGETVRVLLR